MKPDFALDSVAEPVIASLFPVARWLLFASERGHALDLLVVVVDLAAASEENVVAAWTRAEDGDRPAAVLQVRGRFRLVQQACLSEASPRHDVHANIITKITMLALFIITKI